MGGAGVGGTAGTPSGPPFPSIGKWIVYDDADGVRAFDASQDSPPQSVDVRSAAVLSTASLSTVLDQRFSAWSPDGRYLLTSDASRRPNVVDFSGAAPAPARELADSTLLHFWSPDSTSLLLWAFIPTDGTGSVNLVDHRSVAPVAEPIADDVARINWSASAEYLAYIKAVDMFSGELWSRRVDEATPGAPEMLAASVAFFEVTPWASSGTRLAFHEGGRVRIVDAAGSTPSVTVHDGTDAGGTHVAGWGADDETLVFFADAMTHRFDVTSEQVVTAPNGVNPSIRIRGDPWAPDRSVVLGGFFTTLALLPGNRSQPFQPATIPGVADDGRVTWSSDSRWLAIGAQWLVSVENPGSPMALEGSASGPAAFSPDARLLATLAGGALNVRDVSNPTPSAPVPVGIQGAMAMVWAPSSDRLAVRTDRSVWLIELDGTVTSGAEEIDSLATSPFGRDIAWQP